MKNLIILMTLILFTSCNAQIYPLEYKDDVPVGAYYKDLNGELSPYIGLWKGNWNGKTVFLELKKVKFQLDDVYKDRILGERKIINSNGQIEIDRISNFDYNYSEFYGIGINPGNPLQKRISFYPKNMCGIHSELNITNFTGTTMTLHMVAIGGIKTANCSHDAYVQQYGEYPLNFPKDIVLTKQ